MPNNTVRSLKGFHRGCRDTGCVFHEAKSRIQPGVRGLVELLPSAIAHLLYISQQAAMTRIAISILDDHILNLTFSLFFNTEWAQGTARSMRPYLGNDNFLFTDLQSRCLV
jgi:hypothetical protein